MRIGIDVGGTKIAAGLVRGGKVIRRLEVRTRAREGKLFVLNRLREVLAELDSPAVKSIGMGIPGVYEGTKVVRTHNVPCLKGVDLRKALNIRKRFRVDNDVRCQAKAEHRYGAGKGTRHMAIVVPGTGLGFAAVVDGKVLHGSRGITSESAGSAMNPLDVAHGKRPIKLDHVLSGPGIMKRHKKIGGTERFPSEIWTSSERAAKTTTKETATLLGLLLARIVLTFDPELIVLGGRMVDAALLSETRKFAKKYCIYSLPPIKLAKCKDSGIVGAACL